MYKVTTNAAEGQTPEITQTLDELAREGARRMIAAALEAEVEQYVEALRPLRDENGYALVVRNGTSHHERTVQMGAGSVKIRAPRVDDRRPEHRFTSSNEEYSFFAQNFRRRLGFPDCLPCRERALPLAPNIRGRSDCSLPHVVECG